MQVTRLVVHDAQQPGPKSAGAAEPGQRGMCLHKGVLNDVVGIGTCSPQSRHPLGYRGMATHQVREGGYVTGHRLRHQVRVRDLADRLVAQHTCPVLGGLACICSTPERSGWFASAGRRVRTVTSVTPNFDGGSTVPELSLQLYTVREALSQDFDGTLEAIAAMGFTQVEPFRLVDFADELRTGMARHGLSAPTTHMSLQGGDQDETFALARELGIETVIDPYVDPE